MYPTTLTIVLVGFFIWSNIASAAMSSTNYRIDWDTISTGGSDTSSSATYGLRDTLGNTGIGNSSSTTYNLRAGYRQGIYDQVISFEVFGQTSTSTAASSLSSTTITVASTSGFSVGDFIALIQDKGSSQVSAVGQITSIGGSTLTVDALQDGGTAPTIDGTNDYVYRLSGASVGLGTLNKLVMATATIGFNVTADVDDGYTIQVYDDGNLRTSAQDINDVTDGAVTIGGEEYGGRSSDTSVSGSTFDTQDTAFTTSFQPLVEETQGGFERRSFVTLKAAVTPETPQNNTYSHVLSFVMSGNF
jgi:hypothetical protein